MPQDDRYRRRPRRRARHALDGDRRGRPLRPRRHRRLSELGADERGAGQGRRRRAHRHGRADAGRRHSTRWCWPRRGSPASTRSIASAARRRSPRSPTAPATIRPVAKIVGPGQRLCRRRQAPGLRHRRHRHDRRPVRGAGRRRRATTTRTGSPPTCSPRPSTTRRRSRSSSPIRPSLRRRGRRRGRARSLTTLPRARDRRGELARSRRDHRRRRRSPRRWTSPTASRRSISSWPSPIRRRCSPQIRNAGAVFLGRHTPEVIGDYVGGPNHVLPTARSARFSSGLSVFDFVKRTSILKLGPDQLRALGRAGDHARRGRGSRRPRPLGRDPAQPVGRDDARPAGEQRHGRLIAVELDRASLASARGLHRRTSARIAIHDLIADNSFQPRPARAGASAFACRSSTRSSSSTSRTPTGRRSSATSCR